MGRTRDDYSSLPSLHELHDNIPSTALPKPILSGMWTSQSGKSRKKNETEEKGESKGREKGCDGRKRTAERKGRKGGGKRGGARSLRHIGTGMARHRMND